jgi:hypothetical protein
MIALGENYGKGELSQTLVLVTGDGNDNDGRTTFPKIVTEALKKNSSREASNEHALWKVEIISWKRCLSNGLKALRDAYSSYVSIRFLDEKREYVTYRDQRRFEVGKGRGRGKGFEGIKGDGKGKNRGRGRSFGEWANKRMESPGKGKGRGKGKGKGKDGNGKPSAQNWINDAERPMAEHDIFHVAVEAAESAVGSSSEPAHDTAIESAVGSSSELLDAADVDEDDDGEKDTECIICFENDWSKDICLSPCGHRKFCRACADEIVSQEKEKRICPICRTDVERVMDLF